MNRPVLATAFLLWLTGLLSSTPMMAAHAGSFDPVDTVLQVTICANESYIFNGDTLHTPGEYTAVFEAYDGSDSVVVLELSFLPVAAQTVTASICNGETYPFNGESLTQSGTYTAILSAENGCDSTVTLHLTVLPNPVNNRKAGICEGSSYLFEGDTLTESGVYTKIWPAENGCDSFVVLDLKVVPFFEVPVQATVCHGDAYIFGNDTLYQSGVYIDTLVAAGGCDSIVTLTLDVLPAIVTDLEVSICQGEYYLFNGDTLTETTLVTAVLEAANGCDSTVIIALFVLPVSKTTIEASVCEGTTFDYNGDNLYAPGTYHYKFPAENGCDSTVTIILESIFPQHEEISASICPGSTYEFDGESLTQEGTYTAIFTGGNGCDSTVTLTLSVLPESSTQLEASICPGSAYEFNGESLSQAGIYTAVFPAQNGCDSTVTLNLIVLPMASTQIKASVCQGSTYEYQGATLTESGIYTFLMQAENGCDSIVILTLKVLPASSTSLEATICAGAVYPFDGEQLTAAGDYTAVYSGENGCDSTVTLHLKVVPFFETGVEATICAGDFYLFGHDTLTESGLYQRTLEASGGCDSIVILALIVRPAVTTTLEASICAGETYAFNGENLTESGVYTANLEAFNGCDSIVTLHLTVLPVPEVTLEATICQGISYEYNGHTLTEAGIYEFTLEGENGCDSLVTLDLAVLPVQTSSLEATICKGDSYEYNGQTLTAPGAYEFTLEGPNGCDSLVSLYLAVLQPAEDAFAVVNCNGESYEYNGEVLTESGVYEFTFAGGAASGCDSVVTVYLTIFPAIPPTQISAVICAGDTYDFNGITLTAAGTYSFDLPSVDGCDSTIVLELGVLPAVSTTVEASVCKGEGYTFAGDLLFESGTYTALFESVNGCDSTVTLHLAVTALETGVEQEDGVLTAQADDATFQWIDCATQLPVPGATENTFAPAETGNYAVIITQNGCTDTSDCYLVEVLGSREPLGLSAWTLQPNPASQRTAIVFDQVATEEIRAEVYDEAGRLLYRQQIAAGAGRVEIDLSGMPGGTLLVRLAGKTGDAVKLLVKSDQ